MAHRIFVPALALFLGCLAFSAQTNAAEAVAWRSNLDAAKIEAAQSNRLVLLHFYTKTCGPCRLLDKNVFSQPQIAQSIEKNYVPVKVDAEASPALRGAFRIERVPTEVIITPQGNQVASMGSPAKPDEYVGRLSQIANHFRQTSQQLVKASHQAPANVNNAYAHLNVARPAATSPSQSAATQPQAAVTENPYVANSTPQPQVQRPVTTTSRTATPATLGSRYATQPVPTPQKSAAQPNTPQQTPQASVASVQRTQTQMPPNAMPQSYKQNPYATEAQSTAPMAAVAVPTAPKQTVAASQAAPPNAQPQTAAALTPATKQPVVPFVDNRVTPTADNSITPTPQGAVGPSSSEGRMTGTAPLGFDGYCPVTLKQENKWVKGNVEFGIVHRDRLYLFANEQARQQFYANADKYSPVFSGCDPVLMLEQQQEIPGSRQFGYRHKGSFYLFANKITMQKFAQNPDAYSKQVRQAMTTIDSLQNGGTIRR